MLLQKKKAQNSNINPSVGSKPKKTMASLRLQKDLASYQLQPIQFVQLAFPQEQTLQIIHIAIQPQQNSLFYQCRILFELIFPDTYPMDPPKIKCLNKIYHPNITYQGSVCLPLVRQDYEPTVNLTSIICGLIFILTYPNAQDALNTEAGQIMQKNYQMYVNIVNHTTNGHEFKKKIYDKIKKEEWKKILQKYKEQKQKNKLQLENLGFNNLKHSHSQSQSAKEIIHQKKQQGENRLQFLRKQSENQNTKKEDKQNDRKQFEN